MRLHRGFDASTLETQANPTSKETIMTVTLPELTITEGNEIPATVSTRETAPNPFAGKFPTAEGKTLIVTLPSTTDDERKTVDKVVSLAQAAGRAVDTTTRHTRKAVKIGTGKAAKDATEVTFWSVEKIVRPRKPKTESDQPAPTA